MDKEIQKIFDDLGINPKVQKEVWNRVLKNSEFHQIILKEAEIAEEGQKLKDTCGESWHKYLKDIFKLEAEYEEINNELNAIYCIFRKNCASVPEERSAIPLQTEQSSAG